MPQSRPRIVFFGSPGFAVPSLTALCERPDLGEVVAVVSQPDRPQGRGRQLAACPTRIMAQARGIPSLSPTKLRDGQFAAALAALAPDLAVVAAYGRILTPALLAIPRLGCVNVHASLLPRHRGASPIAHAILADDAQIGVCIMQMDAGLDTGAVLARRGEALTATATAAELTVHLAEVGASLLLATLPDILAGRAGANPQPDAGATYAPLLQKRDGLLDFAEDAQVLARRIRAYDPWPGTRTSLHGQPLGILRGRADASGPTPTVVGQVLVAGPEGVAVACGRGRLWLEQVRPAGRRPMSAAAWVAGRGVAVGDQFCQSSGIQAPLP